MMYNNIIKQTEQLSRELDGKNDILYHFYKMILLVSRQDNHHMFQKILTVVF